MSGDEGRRVNQSELVEGNLRTVRVVDVVLHVED
jgi:hypothetical protein